MSKIIFWLVVVFVVLFALRLVNVAKARRGGASEQPKRGQQTAADAMVRCSECGIFLPKAEAVASPRGFRCGDPGCAQRHGNAR
jgi:uncharacterized paraquat-inducible protein A